MLAKVRTATLPPSPTSAGVARRLVAECLEDTDAGGRVDVATLLVSEIVTNAILHTGTQILVEVWASAGVLVRVSDGNPRAPVRRPHDVDAATGRGLDMVEALADAHGVRTWADGKTVWFRLGPAPGPDDDSLPVGWDRHDAGGGAVVPVGTLLDVPVSLYRILQQHNEALLREYELHVLAAPGTSEEPAVVRRVARARNHLAAGVLTGARDEEGGRCRAVVTAPSADVVGFRDLPRVFAEADRLAADGTLLTRPAPPELKALRAWMFEELRAQLDGLPAAPWRLPDDDDLPEPDLPPLEIDLRWIARDDRAVIAADDGNRILSASASAAAVLGWDAADLVGRRLTAIVPPPLREAHLAGFTRHLLTGTSGILNQVVAVSAQHADGGTVPVRLRIQSRPAGRRSHYLAWITPAG